VFVRVDPQQLSKQLALVLGVLGRVAGAAPVSRPRVQVPVRPELELAAVVVRVPGMGDDDHLAA
jgi:hypothetical protein